MARRGIRQVNLVAFVVYPENVTRYVETAEKLFDIKFERMHGPTIIGAHDQRDAYVDFNSGIEILAPLDRDCATCTELFEFLDTHGEGIHGVVFGFEELDAPVANARSLGFTPREHAAFPSDDDERRKYMAAWSKVVSDVKQVRIGPFMGQEIIFTDIRFNGDFEVQ
jgi:hypothetical protein